MAKNKTIAIIDLVEPPEPVRCAMDTAKLEELAESIRRMGVLQPLIVVPVAPREGGGMPTVETGRAVAGSPTTHSYQIVAGHRRFLAARMAGLKEVPCVVYAEDELAKEAAMLHENTYREDLTAAEEGWLYCELAERHQLTEEALCHLVRQKPEYIYARMDLVRKDAVVAKAVAEREVNFSVAKELLKEPDEEHRHYLLRLAKENGASARLVASWVYQHRESQALIAAHPAETVEPPPPPGQTENLLKCLVCGGEHDPYNLRQVYIHYTELDWLKKQLAEAGLKT